MGRSDILTVEQQKRIIQLHCDQGLTPKQIAIRFGVTYDRVQRVLRLHRKVRD
jgi:hypothetical protein